MIENWLQFLRDTVKEATVTLKSILTLHTLGCPEQIYPGLVRQVALQPTQLSLLP
jgi:hypothetical protein